jgi:hypothetical protein
MGGSRGVRNRQLDDHCVSVLDLLQDGQPLFPGDRVVGDRARSSFACRAVKVGGEHLKGNIERKATASAAFNGIELSRIKVDHQRLG